MARVLIMEDEEKMARTLARVLGEEGHITEKAHDGRTGLSRTLEGPSTSSSWIGCSRSVRGEIARICGRFVARRENIVCIP